MNPSCLAPSEAAPAASLPDLGRALEQLPGPAQGSILDPSPISHGLGPVAKATSICHLVCKLGL